LPHAAERAEPVTRALATLPADVICLQEVWLDSHWHGLARALAPRLPHALRPPPAGDAASRCSDAEARPVLACVRGNCGALPESRLAACAISECGHLVARLSSRCTQCLTRDPLRSLAQVKRDCAPLGEDVPRAKEASGPAYVYGGSYGIGVLTNTEVLEHDFLRFESEQLARGALYARVRQHSGSAELHVFCTHLTADTRGVPYPAAGGSWRTEHARQVRELGAWMQRKAGTSAAAVLLGDLNTGPALPEAQVRARVPEQYAAFGELGFSNPYLSRARTVQCSFCSANTLNGGGGGGGSLIDHILVRGPLLALDVERVLDEPLELRVGSGRVRSHLSDHYGLWATLSSARAPLLPSLPATGSL
jgi:endonuclease/exonuclease/phosphatase family metal-dependent hydrolase